VIKKVLIALALLIGVALVGLAGLIGYLQSDSDALRARLLGVVNEQLSVPVQATGLELDVLGQFPDVSLRLDHVFIEDPLRPNSGDTLLYFEEVYAQFGLFSVLRGETILKRVTVSNGALKMRWEEDGRTNFDILKEDTAQTASYLDLKGFTLLNARIHLSGYGESPWAFPFVAERLKLSGVLDAEQFDAKATWELLIPRWNDQSVRIGGSTDFFSNSEVDQILVDNGHVTINDWELDLSGSIQQGMGQWTAFAENLDMSDVMALLPKALVPDPSTIVADGVLDLRVVASTTPAGSRIKAEGDWKKGRLDAGDGWIVGDNVTAHVVFDNGPQARLETATLDISSFAFQSRNSSLSGSFRLDNLVAPRAQATLNIKGQNNVLDVMHWLEFPTWTDSQGHVNGSIGWKQSFSSLEALAEQGVWLGQWSGSIDVKDGHLVIKDVPKPTKLPSARLELRGQDLYIAEAQVQTGKTAARLQGTVYNFLNDDLFHYQMRITGREWTVEDLTDWEIWNGDFTGAPDDGEEFADTYDVEVAVDRLRFGAFSATDVSGRFSGKGLHVESDNVFLRHSGGSLSGRMEWVPMPNDEGQLLLDGQINRVDLKALMASMDNFGQSQLTSEQLSGILDATFRISAPFDADFNLKSDKLLAQVDFQVAKGRITGFEPLQELSRFAEVEDLKDVRFGTVKNQLRIADQTVFIPEMTLENNALVLKVAGEHRFDNVMDFTLQMQLRDLVGGKKTPRSKALDDFIAEESTRGPVWIPIKIQGPADHLKFSLDKKTLTQDIKSSVQDDWKRQGEELRGLFQKPVERPVVPEKKYQFEWEEEPDTNRSFNGMLRSFNRA
jgi:hypothetical protein